MKKILESKIVLVIVTIILSTTVSVIADNVITSNSVSYSNSKTSETTVDGALDELFESVKINEKIVEIEDIISNLQTKINNMYPVGSIYITEKNENPQEIFGGTWERYGVGKTLLSTDGTSGETGGSNTVTLTTNNLPSHSHNINHTHTTATGTITSSGAHTHSTTAKTISSGLTAQSAGAHTHTIYVIQTKLANNSTSDGPWTVGIKTLYTGTTPDAILSAGAHTHNVTGTIPSLSIASSGDHTHTVPSLSTNTISTTSSGNAGSGTSFSVQNPYITVYMWKRTA